MLDWDYHHAALGSSPTNAHCPWDHQQTSTLLMIP
jgi:hypothetical protein